MPLDETISPGQAGHIADHQTIANSINNISPPGSVLLGSASFTGGAASPASITTTANTEVPALAMVITVGARPVAVSLKAFTQMFTAPSGIKIRVWDGAVGGTEVGMWQSETMAAGGSDAVGGLSLLSPALSAGAHTLRFSVALATVANSPSGILGIGSYKTEVIAFEL